MTTAPSHGLWTADFILDLLTIHFLFASYTSLFVLLPLYTVHRGGEEWQIALVVGSLGVTGVVARQLSGPLIERLGGRFVAVAGTAIFGIASLLFIPAVSVWWLVPVRLFQGVGMAVGPVAIVTIIANLAPVRRRAEAMGYMGNAIAVGTVYAPVLAFYLLTELGFAYGFLFSGFAALLASLLALGMSASRTRAAETSSGEPNSSGRGAPLISRGALFPTAVFLSYTFTTAPINTFLPLLAEDRGLGNPGLYFTVNAFTTMIIMLASGRLADRLGPAALIIPGLLTTTTGMFLLMTATVQPTFLLAGFLAGAGYGLFQPGLLSLTVNRVPPRERSSALATIQQAWDFGGSGGTLVVGPFAGLLGVAATFGIAGGVNLLGALGFIFGNSRRSKIQRKRDAPAVDQGPD